MTLKLMQEYPVDVSCIPELVAQLRSKGVNGSFGVLMFRPPEFINDAPDDDVNLQYSMENNIVGLDWVLLGPRNISDKERIADFMARHGHTVITKRHNGVDYLRVEDDTIAELGNQIITELYKITSDIGIGLLVNDVDIDLDVLGPPLDRSPVWPELPAALQVTYSTFMARYHEVMARYHGWMATEESALLESERDELIQTCAELEAVLNEFPSVITTMEEPDGLYSSYVDLLTNNKFLLSECLDSLRTQYKAQLFN